MATAMMGMGLTVLGIVLAYIWKSNGKLQRDMADRQKYMIMALERIEKGQEKGQEKLAEMLTNQTKILMDHTKILEKIEGKIK